MIIFPFCGSRKNSEWTLLTPEFQFLQTAFSPIGTFRFCVHLFVSASTKWTPASPLCLSGCKFHSLILIWDNLARHDELNRVRKYSCLAKGCTEINRSCSVYAWSINLILALSGRWCSCGSPASVSSSVSIKTGVMAVLSPSAGWQWRSTSTSMLGSRVAVAPRWKWRRIRWLRTSACRTNARKWPRTCQVRPYSDVLFKVSQARHLLWELCV